MEIGPGPARLLIPAAQRVLPEGEVVGLDIQPGMIERLKARAAQAGVSNLTAILGDAIQQHFPPESIDVIYLCTVLGDFQTKKRHYGRGMGHSSQVACCPSPKFPQSTLSVLRCCATGS